MCVCMPMRSSAGEHEDCLVNMAALLLCSGLCRLVRDSVSDSTRIKDGLILGIVLVPISVYFPTGKLISGTETSIWSASDILCCLSCLLGGCFLDFQLANSVTGF